MSPAFYSVKAVRTRAALVWGFRESPDPQVALFLLRFSAFSSICPLGTSSSLSGRRREDPGKQIAGSLELSQHTLNLEI